MNQVKKKKINRKQKWAQFNLSGPITLFSQIQLIYLDPSNLI